MEIKITIDEYNTINQYIDFLANHENPCMRDCCKNEQGYCCGCPIQTAWNDQRKSYESKIPNVPFVFSYVEAAVKHRKLDKKIEYLIGHDLYEAGKEKARLQKRVEDCLLIEE